MQTSSMMRSYKTLIIFIFSLLSFQFFTDISR